MTMRTRAKGPCTGPRQQDSFRSEQNVLTMRASVAAVLAACMLFAPLDQSHAQSGAAPTQLDLPAQQLSEAINALASHSGVQIAAPAGLLRQRQAPALSGRYTVRQALDALLSGSDLEVEEIGGRYVIRQRGARAKAQDVTTLETVEVTGQVPERMAVYDTPDSVAVVTREEIDRLPPRNVSDVLADIPGVATSQSRQNPGVAVNIRGLQGFGRVNVMIDGARQNYQQSGHGDSGSVYLDADLLARVEVTKGPVAAAGGAGMIGGMVNFRTLTIDDVVESGEQVGGRVNLVTGSNAYHFSGSAAFGWRLSDEFDLTAAVSRKSVGSFRKGTRNTSKNYGDAVVTGGGDWNEQYHNELMQAQMQGVSGMTDQRQWSGLAKLGWRPNADHRFTLGYVGFKADYDEGALDDDIKSAPINASNKLTSETITLQHEWQPVNRWFDWRASMYFTTTENDAERQAQPAMNVAWSLMHFETNTFGMTAENRARFGLGGMDVTWAVGGEFYRDWTRPGAISQETGANRSDPEIMVGGTPRGQRTVTSGFTNLTLEHGDWLEVGGGLRYDWFGLKGDGLMRVDTLYNGNGSRPEYSALYTEFVTSRHDGEFAPSLRLAVKPVERVQLFANYGRGIRPPSITESFRYGAHPGAVSFPYYPNPNLNAERSRNWELGANIKLDGLLVDEDMFRIKAAWFNTKVDNYMVLASIMSPSSLSAQTGANSPMSFINLMDPFRTRGLELQADYDAGLVFASAGFTHSLIDTGDGRYDPYPLGSLVGFPSTTLGKGGGADIWYLLPPSKKFTFSGGVRLFGQRLTLGARMRHETPANNTSAFSSNAYSRSFNVYDAWASYEISKNLTARVSAENLLNENYAEMNGISYWIAPGRTVMGSVNWRF
ncbi:TonB-dependent receptor [Kerstersia gyiorum]|nr:TonB-dependent receptor [Kerstersia gyiorum]